MHIFPRKTVKIASKSATFSGQKGNYWNAKVALLQRESSTFTNRQRKYSV